MPRVPLIATLNPKLSPASASEAGSFCTSLSTAASALRGAGLKPAGPDSSPAAMITTSATIAPRTRNWTLLGENACLLLLGFGLDTSPPGSVLHVVRGDCTGGAGIEATGLAAC